MQLHRRTYSQEFHECPVLPHPLSFRILVPLQQLLPCPPNFPIPLVEPQGEIRRDRRYRLGHVASPEHGFDPSGAELVSLDHPRGLIFCIFTREPVPCFADRQ